MLEVIVGPAIILNFFSIYDVYEEAVLKASRTITVLTKTTAAQNEVALSYHRVRGLYSQAVVIEATIIVLHLRLSFTLNDAIHIMLSSTSFL